MRARLWQEFDRARTINTGDGFVTVEKDETVLIFVAKANEPVMRFLAAALEAAEKIEDA